ncbi:MAG: DNA mismatch repair endonuclease MutL [Candidatus Latescibacteria bacterium]|nr:DNA mismatch repair endonuclease MutL [Candidatus Latescibacterota bacterium]
MFSIFTSILNMPNKIRILPDDIANRIAAGEVVERPASVAKELIENSVDAGSDRIVVEVAAGGKESLRVSDNGCGMSRDDALLALERHATSKIQSLDDLKGLLTHGFRGEALPSIAAVSRMTLETRLTDAVEGTRVSVVGGRVQDVSAIGRGQGTAITLHGLFFNVPARRKFLKSVDTEFRHIVNAVTAMAMAYPEIGFDLKHNGRQVLQLGRSRFDRRAEQIFGVRYGADAIGIESEVSGIGVRGFVGKPESARKSGAQQVLIVNNRWVQHKAIGFAVYEGYGGLLPKGLAPSYCLCLSIDPARVDVNVHPSKREVRFADERSIYGLITRAVQQSLRGADIIPEMGDDVMPVVSVSIAESPEITYQPGQPKVGGQPQMALPLTVSMSQGKVKRGTGINTEGLDEEDFARVSVWQLHSKYILAHIKNGLIAIDQQVAHQRILYERAIDNMHTRPATSQRLLFPLTLDFGVKEIFIVREAMPLLEKMGFGIRDFGGHTVVVDAIPMGMRTWQDGQLLRDMIRDMAEAEQATSVPPSVQGRQVAPEEHRLASVYAWHTSIRTGEDLSTEEMRALIDQLFATREPFVSPYGKPTLVKIGLDEIDNRFKR